MVACSKIVLLATGAAALVAPPALSVRQATALAASKQEPHGGKLVNLFGDGLKAADCDTTLQMTERQSCDVELLCNGGFSPLFQAVACVSYCASRDSSVGMFEGSSRAVAIFCDR